MHAFSLQPIALGDQSFGPGVFDCTPGEFHALSQRAALRPATSEEIETAALTPDTQAAAARPRRSTRTPAAAS